MSYYFEISTAESKCLPTVHCQLICHCVVLMHTMFTLIPFHCHPLLQMADQYYMQACRLFSPRSCCCFSLFYCTSREVSFVGTNSKISYSSSQE